MGLIYQVFHNNHSFVNGEEQCMCTFVVIWQHGPGAGCLANKKIENICIVRSNAELDPNVDIFSKIVREKLESAAYCNGTIHGEIASLPMKLGSTCAQRFYQASLSDIGCSTIFFLSKHKKNIFANTFF